MRGENPYLVRLQRSMFRSAAHVLWERQKEKPNKQRLRQAEENVTWMFNRLKDAVGQ